MRRQAKWVRRQHQQGGDEERDGKCERSRMVLFSQVTTLLAEKGMLDILAATLMVL